MGSGDHNEELQGGSKEFRSLSGDTIDYQSFEEYEGSGGEERDEGAPVKKEIEIPRSGRVKSIARRISKKETVRPYPSSWEVTEDESSHSTHAHPTSHSIPSQQGSVSISHGDLAHMPFSVHLEPKDVETSHLPPPMTTSLDAQSRLPPITSIFRTLKSFMAEPVSHIRLPVTPSPKSHRTISCRNFQRIASNGNFSDGRKSYNGHPSSSHDRRHH